MGYAEKLAAPIDVNCSRMGQVSVTRHSRRMLLQTLFKQLDKTDQIPYANRGSTAEEPNAAMLDMFYESIPSAQERRKKDRRYVKLRKCLIQESETRESITKRIKGERRGGREGRAINNFVTLTQNCC
jgi:hypothetical protein